MKIHGQEPFTILGTGQLLDPVGSSSGSSLHLSVAEHSCMMIYDRRQGFGYAWQ